MLSFFRTGAILCFLPLFLCLFKSLAKGDTQVDVCLRRQCQYTIERVGGQAAERSQVWCEGSTILGHGWAVRWRVSLSRYYQLLSNTPSCRKLKTYCSWILQILPTHNHSPNPIFLYVQCVPFPAFLSHFNYHDPYSGIHFLIAEPWQALQIAPPCPRLL